jgi:multiple sugar transport system substrate-binding protein
MKKSLLLFMSILLIGALLVGCATPTAAPTEAPAAPAAATEAPAQPASGEKIKLVIWWWGEQEAPGAQQWMDETIANYTKEHPNIEIEAVLQSTDTLIPSFQAAAAAKQGPDIQYFWGGVWTLENVWSGALVPLDDLILPRRRDPTSTTLSGRMTANCGYGLVSLRKPVRLQPTLFEQAGLDPENPPKTWDDLKAACGKLNAGWRHSDCRGFKDGWFGGWRSRSWPPTAGQ